MIILKPFINHFPTSERIVRNNTGDGNNTIFSESKVFSVGMIIPGYNRFSQPFYLTKARLYNEIWKKIYCFRPRYKEISRFYR